VEFFEMSLEPSSSRIAVVGTGVIGASWAAYFLAKGFDVAATDPADGGLMTANLRSPTSRLRFLFAIACRSLTHIGQG
jgi:glycine/D-amino acid oxidase-like deaminating enzyme